MQLIIGDDHLLIAESIRLIFDNLDEPIETLIAASAEELLKLFKAYPKADLALIEHGMPGVISHEDLRRIHNAANEIPVALFSSGAVRFDIDTAIELGFVGYISKSMTARGLVAAVKLMIAGECYWPHNTTENTASLTRPLSKDEAAVVDQLFLGRANKEIAVALDISEAAVKMHIRHLCKRLSAKNRTDLVLRAIEKQAAPAWFQASYQEHFAGSQSTLQ